MLHWGVRIGKQEWVPAPKAMQPAGTEQSGDIALETAFEDNEALEVGGKTVKLQKLQLLVPAKEAITGVTFVIRSSDGSAWFRDGGPWFHILGSQRPQPAYLQFNAQSAQAVNFI